MSLTNLNRLLGLLNRAADRRKPCDPVIMPYGAKPSFRRGNTFTAIPRVKPEEKEVSSGQIAAFLDEVYQNKKTNIESVVVAKEDSILCEAAFGVQKSGIWKATFSECKSITAIAIGLLWDEGRLDVDEKVVDILRDKTNPLQRLSWSHLSVYDLLTMQSAAAFNEGEANVTEEWVREFFAGGTVPIKGFQYNSLNTYMLSAIVREKTGCGMGDYLGKRLFEPLGITEYYFEKSPEGIEKGGWGLYILPEDLVKIGLMLANRGTWMGKRVLSEKWIARMTRRHVRTGDQYGSYDYGFQIWVHRQHPVWLFNGMFGQNMFIDAEKKLVVAVNASNPDLFQTNPVFEIYERIFLESKEHWEPANLEKLIASFRDRKPVLPWWKRFFKKEETIPAECWELNGTAYLPDRMDATLGIMPRMMQIMENQYTGGLSKLSFRVSDGKFWLIATEGEIEYAIPIGFGAGEESRVLFGKTEWLISSLGRFGRDEDGRLVLILEIAFLETPFHRCFRFYFDEDSMELSGNESPGRDFVTRFVETMGKDILEKPLVSGILDKLDTDLLEYKLDVMFRPNLKMKKQR
ncbi:MAG: serine hydrolase [Clostridia bacterium]|nr:serine hydrolase [Clostridia bacterium]